MRTNFNTGIASDASILIPDNLVGCQLQGLSRAGCDALTAVDAHANRFRIMTVITPERT